MTLKKAGIYCQVLVLALLPGFIARPIMVGIHNSASVSFQQNDSRILAFTAPFNHVSPSRVAFRSVEREMSDVTVWVPCVSKIKCPSISEWHFTIVSASPSLTPQQFLVLRI